MSFFIEKAHLGVSVMKGHIMKRSLAFLLSLLILIAFPVILPASAADIPLITANSAFGSSGKWVSVPVTIENNTGFCAAKISVKYDTSKLSLTSVEKGSVCEGGFFLTNNITDFPFNVVIASTKNITENGILFNLSFEVLPTTGKGEYDVILSIKEDDFVNIGEASIATQTKNGKVVVTGDAQQAITGETVLKTPPANWATEEKTPEPTLANFMKKNAFSSSVFGDVTDDKWYYGEVGSAYEYGLMLGTGDGVFSPDGGVTVAEGITMAARLNDIYRGGTGVMKSAEDKPWYDAYVSYAVKRSIITKTQFDSYTRKITRKEMAVLFAKALPETCYAQLNQVETLPDVSPFDDTSYLVFRLYNAGILTGNDAYGTFNPDAEIKRSEAAAIINRVAVPSMRKRFSLTDSGKDWYADLT